MAGTVPAAGNNHLYVYKDTNKHQSLFWLSSAVFSNADLSQMDSDDSCCLVLYCPTGCPKASQILQCADCLMVT